MISGQFIFGRELPVDGASGIQFGGPPPRPSVLWLLNNGRIAGPAANPMCGASGTAIADDALRSRPHTSAWISWR